MGVLVGKIVLTGGPCAGKTTTISKIEEHLEEMGYHVLVLNECATEIIKSGIRPFGSNKISVYDFQNEILNLQLFKEKRIKDIVKILPDSTKCIMLSDRGCIDNKAYLGEELFSKLLKQNNIDEKELLDDYDLVIHMITVATEFKKEKYSNSSNTARFEDAEEAIDLDKRTNEAWCNHKNFKIVNVCETLEEKINKVINLVDELVNNL